jgi:hypothetical protein
MALFTGIFKSITQPTIIRDSLHPAQKSVTSHPTILNTLQELSQMKSTSELSTIPHFWSILKLLWLSTTPSQQYLREVLNHHQLESSLKFAEIIR